jgi:hypothetical protein
VVYFIKYMLTTILVVLGSLLTAYFMHPEENIGACAPPLPSPQCEVHRRSISDARILTHLQETASPYSSL